MIQPESFSIPEQYQRPAASVDQAGAFEAEPQVGQPASTHSAETSPAPATVIEKEPQITAIFKLSSQLNSDRARRLEGAGK